MKKPTVDELFGNIFKPPKKEEEWEKAVRIAKELVKKIDKIK